MVARSISDWAIAGVLALSMTRAAGATPVGSAPETPSPVSSVREQLQRLLEQMGPDASRAQRRLVEESLIMEAPQTPEAIARAQEAQRSVTIPPSLMHGECDVILPLDVFFANYTIGVDGRVIPGSTGWTKAERALSSRFLCRMLPILAELYGPPFQRWSITLVKNLGYSASWIFFPSLLEIHSDGAWNARLLAHEFIHAFRGQRGLTSDADWNYSPSLSGFEEGFAEGVAYLAMNTFVARHCSAGDCSDRDVPSYSFWYSFLEPVYDFANDSSLTCEGFWSDSGGTSKVYERYLMAAAAVMRLETALPGFSRRFNEEYYGRIRADASYRPSREAVSAIVEAVSPLVEGVPARTWVDRQRIFDSRTIVGKREWTTNQTPYQRIGEDRMRFLFFLETFPDGSEWAQYIPDCPLVPGGTDHWLYYRLNGTRGELWLRADWSSGSVANHGIRMQIPPVWENYHYRGCNHVVGGFGTAELRWVRNLADCHATWVPEPTCIEQPAEFGLYRLETAWRNPQYARRPGPPGYPMPYDFEQATVSSTEFLLAGRMPPDYDPYGRWFVGGVVGASTGQVTLTHSARPGTITARVSNGAFHAEIPTCETWPPSPSCWVAPYAAWTSELISAPGTITLRFEGDDGSYREEQRTIVFGNRGEHELLLPGGGSSRR